MNIRINYKNWKSIITFSSHASQIIIISSMLFNFYISAVFFWCFVNLISIVKCISLILSSIRFLIQQSIILANNVFMKIGQFKLIYNSINSYIKKSQKYGTKICVIKTFSQQKYEKQQSIEANFKYQESNNKENLNKQKKYIYRWIKLLISEIQPIGTSPLNFNQSNIDQSFLTERQCNLVKNVDTLDIGMILIFLTLHSHSNLNTYKFLKIIIIQFFMFKIILVFYFFVSGLCCYTLCTVCKDNFLKCQNCIENASLNNENQCSCNEDYRYMPPNSCMKYSIFVGVIVGPIAFVLVLCILCICCGRRRRKIQIQVVDTQDINNKKPKEAQINSQQTLKKQSKQIIKINRMNVHQLQIVSSPILQIQKSDATFKIDYELENVQFKEVQKKFDASEIYNTNLANSSEEFETSIKNRMYVNEPHVI